MEDLYSKLGASSAKEDVHLAIQSLDKGIAPGAFCKVLPDILGGDANFVNAMHADGAGTKSILAYLYWRETGDVSVWRGIAQDALVMNLDDLLCVGAINNFVVSSTIGRNKRLIPAEVIKEIIEGTDEFCSSMRKFGINMVFAGGETADVGDLVQTIIVDSNFTVRFPKKDLIDASKIKPGNCIVGLSSTGKASYETVYNSGIASNGITLARHTLLNHQYGIDFPECSDPYILQNGGYSGRFKLFDSPLKQMMNLGQALLSPTRTYAPVVKAILENIPTNSISGIIHNTGGAHSKVKKFVSNASVHKNVTWPIPEIFTLIQQESKIPWKEMFQTFNCGVRLEIYCDEKVANQICTIAKQFEISASIIGQVYQEREQEVILRSADQEWML